jgi:hypothetical protein
MKLADFGIQEGMGNVRRETVTTVFTTPKQLREIADTLLPLIRMPWKKIIDAALGGPWDVLGELIVEHGQEDSSGLRRMLAGYIRDRDFERFCNNVPISREEFDRVRGVFVQAWGEPVTTG